MTFIKVKRPYQPHVIQSGGFELQGGINSTQDPSYVASLHMRRVNFLFPLCKSFTLDAFF